MNVLFVLVELDVIIKIIKLINLNFFKFIKWTNLDSLYNPDIAPKKKIEDLIHLAELCIDLLQQNEEHHSEVNYNFNYLNPIQKLIK